MEYKNGFFQIIHKEDGTYLKVYPAVNGGEELALDDVARYLSHKKIIENDIKALNKFILSATQPSELKISFRKILPENEYLILTINSNKTAAVGRFYPPSSKGKLMSREEILNELVRSRIKYGVVEENLDGYLKKRQFSTDILLAKAMLPVDGKSAVITYNFSMKNSAKPKMNEDGSVDFHQIDIINHVSKGDILATLDPVDYGRPGIDVCGTVIRPKKVVNKTLRLGLNVHLSEDGNTMFADVSGHVSLNDDRVFVSNTFDIRDDVDSSTGDIIYDGNVTIKGNVLTGFCVRAKGNIIVDGVVEGAILEAEGQIVLKRGIQGMNRGILKANGNIVAKFIENCEVIAGGDITTDAIMHSKVTARGEIIVSGKRGLITGGEIRSGSMISMKVCGSKMGTSTLLEVGIDPVIMENLKQLEHEIESMMDEKNKMLQIISLMQKKNALGEQISAEKAQYFKTAKQNYVLLDAKIKDYNHKSELLNEELGNSQGGRIRVEGLVFSGVKIVISNVNYFVRNEEQHCQYVRDGADIKSLSI